MTAQERKAIRKMLEDRQHPSARAVEYSSDFSQRIDTTAEAMRCLNSLDYKLGWKACHESMTEVLLFILTAKPKDLIKYAGKA